MNEFETKKRKIVYLAVVNQEDDRDKNYHAYTDDIIISKDRLIKCGILEIILSMPLEQFQKSYLIEISDSFEKYLKDNNLDEGN